MNLFSWLFHKKTVQFTKNILLIIFFQKNYYFCGVHQWGALIQRAEIIPFGPGRVMPSRERRLPLTIVKNCLTKKKFL